MSEFTFVVKDESHIQEIIEEIQRAGEELLSESADRVYRAVKTPGKPPTYPIAWDSEKQRRAFFATGGFGDGIPYRRRGVYEGSWQMEREKTQYTLYTAYPKARYIGGNEYGGGQSRIHGDRWPIVANLVEKDATWDVVNELEKRINDIAGKYAV